ncbi:MAG: efflux RND transporter periplasmic adaptor subunit [Pseudomonadales bacterium]|nr:efflux RND transporter periplasmic adaptor subunit [Pseudomonadales bacterium]
MTCIRFLRSLIIMGLLCITFDVRAEASGPVALVETGVVSKQNLAETIRTFGIVDAHPDQVHVVSLPYGGLIDKVWVSTGQRVSAGDRLLSVVASPDGRRQFQQAQDALTLAERELARQRRLRKQNLASNADVEKASAADRDARAALASLSAQGLVDEARTLTAPVSGIVENLAVKQGDRVPGDTAALLVASNDHLVARLGVEPENVPRIVPGMNVQLSPVFGDARPIGGVVREVHGMIDPSTHLVEVLVDLDVGTDLALGVRVAGRINLKVQDAVVVPRSAVLDDGKQAYVFVVSDSIAHRIVVTTGIEADGVVAVQGTLAPGDHVVTLGNYELEDGMPVRENTP